MTLLGQTMPSLNEKNLPKPLNSPLPPSRHAPYSTSIIPLPKPSYLSKSRKHPSPSLSVTPGQDSIIEITYLYFPSTDKTKYALHQLYSKLNRYYGTYPTAAKPNLTPFGRPSRNHSFLSESTFDHIISLGIPAIGLCSPLVSTST